MPLYNYLCKKCGASRDEVRGMDDRDILPNAEDGGDCQHEWERRITPVRLTRGENWAGKGNW